MLCLHYFEKIASMWKQLYANLICVSLINSFSFVGENEWKKSLVETVSALFPAQPAGVPEILKKSLHSCSVRGGEEVFIIGKNFLKDTKVIFHENVSGKNCVYFESDCLWTYGTFSVNMLHFPSVPDEKSWKAEAEIDMELFHQVKIRLFLCYFCPEWLMPTTNELSR